MNMQLSNGNFEKYKSEMLRMYQQKNRPVNSTENNYINNDQDRFYNDLIKSNDRPNVTNDETNYFSTQQISDEIRLGDDFPPASYRQDISPHTMRGDSPIEYDSEGNRTSNLMFDNMEPDGFNLRENERQLINESSETELNNSRLSQNLNESQGNNLNLENMFQNENEDYNVNKYANLQEKAADSNLNLNLNQNNINTSDTMQKQEDWMNFEARNTSNGFLKVQVYSAQGAFPLKDARVVISKELDNQQKIFYEMVTDESGITQPVSLPAPDASHSFVVDGMRPYENYNIEVSKQGFQSTLREGLPIFPGVVSLQPIQLRPLLASEQDNNYNVK